MGIETGLMAASLASSMYSGYKGSKAKKKNQKAADRAYQDNSGMIKDAQGKLAQPGSAETGLEEFLKNLSGGSGLDIPGIEGSTAYNSSQDALMQMVNRSAADQLGNAGTQLNDLATNGGAQNVDSLLAALGVQQNAATDDQAARLNAQSSGLGQLAGTASRIGEARLRGGMQRDNNALNAGIRNTAMENAQNRRLAAAGQLGQLNLGAGQLNLGAAQGLTGLAGLLSANQLGRGQLALGQQGQQISGYSALAQAQGLRNNQNTDLMKLMLMNQAPMDDGSSPFADALGSSANSMIALRRMGQGGRSASNGVRIPSYNGAGSFGNPIMLRR